jgi:hypothetical protein|nr:MAG TPA: hypothetical protein [Caudoviricetes sp.]
MESKEYVLSKMRDIGLQAAEVLQAKAPEMDGIALIDNEDDIPEFNPDKHQYLNWKVGEVVRDDGQVWQLLQPYDSTIYKDHPKDMRAQWSLCHTKDPAKAKPYVAPHGQSGMYMKDECCIAGDGKTYKSKIDNNVWPPTEYPDGWEIVEI